MSMPLTLLLFAVEQAVIPAELQHASVDTVGRKGKWKRRHFIANRTLESFSRQRWLVHLKVILFLAFSVLVSSG